MREMERYEEEGDRERRATQLCLSGPMGEKEQGWRRVEERGRGGGQRKKREMRRERKGERM